MVAPSVKKTGCGLGPGAIPKPGVASVANVSTAMDGTREFSGTSSATPYVAGLAALILQMQPFHTVESLETQLRFVAADNDLGAPGFDTDHGYGLSCRCWKWWPVLARPGTG